ncbi:hypothetical protein PDESU_02574 [Pontiella desulfatans]|uniref:Uncharacterized protein n=1 Tax=Pontiella desulfatans TaxID=2750659 RepID=A0A6C2U2B8_PONDE|nr:hypothetical protein PDESU_02574 [Pontiella desulfatans]
MKVAYNDKLYFNDDGSIRLVDYTLMPKGKNP